MARNLLYALLLACLAACSGTIAGSNARDGDSNPGDTVNGDTSLGDASAGDEGDSLGDADGDGDSGDGNGDGGDGSPTGTLYLPETPYFDLDVAEAAINAQRAGRGTAARPTPPTPPQGSLTPVDVSNDQDANNAADEGSTDITLQADLGLLRVDTAVDVMIRLNGHVIDVLALTHFANPTGARRLKIIGPGGIGQVSGSDFVGGVPEDITFEGIWFSRALKSTPDDGVTVNMSGRRIAFLHCIGRGYDSANRGAWGLLTGNPGNIEDVVIYGSNIAADPVFTDDGDNWGVRAGHINRYWIVDTRIQADTWRQANRIYRLSDSVPGYTTPFYRDTARHTTFVNTFHGHAYASVGAMGTNFNLGVFSKDVILVSAQRGASAPGFTLLGPNGSYDEETWVWEGFDVFTDAGTIDATLLANLEASADMNEDFDLDFTLNGEANTYTTDTTIVDAYANNTNWPDVVSPTVGLVGSNPHDAPPF